MTGRRELFQNLVHFRSFGLFCCFVNGNNAEFCNAAAVFNLDNVAYLNVVRRLYDLAVDRNEVFTARFIRNGAAIDYARNLKIFI